MDDVNKLVGFRIEPEQLLSWALDVDRLAPDASPAKISFLLDAFKTGEIEWDRNQGIQNIFQWLPRIRVNSELKFEILKARW
jgi:hypothetical protein